MAHEDHPLRHRAEMSFIDLYVTKESTDEITIHKWDGAPSKRWRVKKSLEYFLFEAGV